MQDEQQRRGITQAQIGREALNGQERKGTLDTQLSIWINIKDSASVSKLLWEWLKYSLKEPPAESAAKRPRNK